LCAIVQATGCLVACQVRPASCVRKRTGTAHSPPSLHGVAAASSQPVEVVSMAKPQTGSPLP